MTFANRRWSTLVERLIGKGIDVAIYDREVSQATLIGANKEFIEREIPHVWTLVPSLGLRGAGAWRDNHHRERIAGIPGDRTAAEAGPAGR